MISNEPDMEGPVPNYVFLLYGRDGDIEWEPGSPGWDAQMSQHAAFAEAVSEAGATIVVGAALARPGSARTVRGGDRTTGSTGRTVVDGPFAETREVLGGVYIVEAADLDAALALARRCPEQVVEVRPAID